MKLIEERIRLKRWGSRVALFMAVSALGFAALSVAAEAPSAGKAPSWKMNATIIEACSCPMFCQCYFNTKPAAHQVGHEGHGMAEHFCRFNNAIKVNKGSYGKVKLDGAKFWVAGDLGGDFSKGEMDWAVLHFDPTVTKEQRDAIATILGHLYPVKWKAFRVAEDAPVEWKATKDRAEARLDGGKTAEVVLQRAPGMTEAPAVIKNLKYWGAPRNDGFVLMPNVVEAYRAGDKPFEFRGTTGFLVTVDIDSKSVAQAGGGGGK
ncbi:MAG: DUF1326 domain-containing protein [Nitrospirae bacterium]|nr:DUF1326 domain-containing protein [Nitrospirota bacterium]